MRCARAESRVRSKSRRKGTRRYMLTNNNNSDSGYFAYSNNRMPFPVSLSLSLQVSRRDAELEAQSSHAPPWSRRISLRLASYQKFICLPTNSSKSIDSTSKAPSSLEEIYLPIVYLELLLMLPLSTGPAAGWPSKANSASDSNPTFIADINSFNGLILNI